MAARDFELVLHSQLKLTRIVVFVCPQVKSAPIGKVASVDCLQENLQADALGDLPESQVAWRHCFVVSRLLFA